MNFLVFFSFLLLSNLKIEETFIVNESCLTIYLKNFPIIRNSETLYFNRNLVQKENYFIDYERGIINLRTWPNLVSCTVKIVYLYLPFLYLPLPSPFVKKIQADPFLTFDSTNKINIDFLCENIILEGEKEIKLHYHTKEGIGFNQRTNFYLKGNAEEIDLEGFFNSPKNNENGLSIKELENSYLKMKTKTLSLIWGNQNKEIIFSDFGKFYSQGTGITFFYSYPHETIYSHYLTTPLKYEKIQFYGKDFIQGPYYLKKNKSIRVLPNSERVYLDGSLLKRGNNEDYIIDYESGFIKFTNRRIITSRNFIEVDFLYEEEMYEKDNIYLGFSTNYSLVKTRINWCWEKNKNKKNIFDNELKNHLIQIGNDTSKAYIKAWRYVGKNNGDYEKEGEVFSYVGTNKGSYLVNFTFVGESLGDYEYDNTRNCYYYVGKNKGKYLPYYKIDLPQENLFTSIDFEIPLNENLNLQFSGIINRKDENLLSPYGDTNRYGYGIGFHINHWQEKFSWVFKNYNLFKNYQNLSWLKKEEITNFSWKNKTVFQINFFPSKDLNIANQLELIKKRESWDYFGFSKLNFFFNELFFKKDYGNRKNFSLSISPICYFFNPFYSFSYQNRNAQYFLNHSLGANFYFKKIKLFLNHEIEKEKNYLSQRKKINKWGITNETNPKISLLFGLLENSLFSDLNFNYTFKDIFQFILYQKISNEEEVLEEIRFIKVKKGEGNYSKDTLTNEYYPDSSGEYLREIIPLRGNKKILKTELNGYLFWKIIQKLKLNLSANFISSKIIDCQFLTEYCFREFLILNYQINYSLRKGQKLIFENQEDKKLSNLFSIKKELLKSFNLAQSFQIEKKEKRKNKIYHQKEKNYGLFTSFELKEKYNLILKPGIFFIHYQYFSPFHENYLIKKISLNIEKNEEIAKDFYLKTFSEIIYRLHPQKILPLELVYYEPRGFSYNFSVTITKRINQNLIFDWELCYLKEGFKEKEIKVNFSSRFYF